MKYILLMAAPVVLSLCSCTGDPNAGGIFWSESMAQERLQNLRAEQAAKQAELDEAQKTKSSLLRRKNAL